MESKLQASNLDYILAKPLQLLIVFYLVLLPYVAIAEEPKEASMLSSIQETVSQTWQSTDYELYIPVNVWHNRHYYSDEKIDGFNENPWGLGLGKYRFDNEGDWHGLYAMAFFDSHRKIEPAVGYGFQKIWHSSENTRLGLGYTVAVTARKEYHYIPTPIILPLVSVQYKGVAVQSTYVPGGNGYGNILFTWLRWQL